MDWDEDFSPSWSKSHRSTLRQVEGMMMLAGCLFLWVFSSAAVQVIATDIFNFQQPLFVTLFNSVVGIIFLWPYIPCRFQSTNRKNAVTDSVTLAATARMSCSVGVLWVCSQCMYNVSLLHTSVATNTVLSSTSSVFTFLFSLLLTGNKFRQRSCMGVVLCFLGCCLVACQAPIDASVEAVHTTPLGRALALASAALFALCSVLLDKLSPPGFDPGLFLGLNGVLALALTPFILGIANLLQFEVLRLPDRRVLTMLILNAGFGCLFANYLYSGALLRLSPTMANLGLSLSIPLSASVDTVVLKEHSFTAWWFAGAALTSAGVLCAALDLQPEVEMALPEELQSLMEEDCQNGQSALSRRHSPVSGQKKMLKVQSLEC